MSRYEVEVTIRSAKDLKNVNWRYGPTRPYAVLWVDPERKLSTRADDEGDTSPNWDQRLVLPLPPSASIEDTTLYIDVVHYATPEEEDTKPLIGSAKLKLHEVVDEVGIGQVDARRLKLKRPSGRPHGKLEVDVVVKENRYQHPAPADPYAPAYGTRDFGGQPAYGAPPYGVAPYSAAPPAGYPYGVPPPTTSTYGEPPYGQPTGYGQPAGYGQPTGYGQPAGYGQPSYGQQVPVQEEKKSKFGGMGTGLAVGALAGGVGAIALMEGYDALEDHVADEAAEKVEDDYGGDDGDDGGW